jgi:hypothetical protein
VASTLSVLMPAGSFKCANGIRPGNARELGH